MKKPSFSRICLLLLCVLLLITGICLFRSQNRYRTAASIMTVPPSRNFILALLDTEKRVLYYIQYDS